MSDVEENNRKNHIEKSMLNDIKKNTKYALLMEALRLFAEKGFEAVSVSQIAKAVNISAPAIYKHYKNKQELFDAIMELSDQGYQQQMAELKVDYNIQSDLKNTVLDMTEKEQEDRMIQLFVHTLHDEYPSLLRKFMTIEQFHIKEIATVYNERYVECQIRAHEELFQLLMNEGKVKLTNAKIMALSYISPVIVMIGVCDREPEKEAWATQLIREHIREFNKNYRIE